MKGGGDGTPGGLRCAWKMSGSFVISETTRSLSPVQGEVGGGWGGGEQAGLGSMGPPRPWLWR